MTRVLVTGAAGFVGGYLVEELLSRKYEVVGVDNLSKYGPVAHRYDSHERYRFIEGDARDSDLLYAALADCTYFIAGAAMAGGIPFVNRYPYDILAMNNQITTASCDAAIRAMDAGVLRKVIYISSSSVFDSANVWPTAEGDQLKIPPPQSSYGLQKLGVEYYARAAWDQYGLPYTIVRPSNCVGVGETRALDAVELVSGNLKLATAHVIPDLVQKALRNQSPLHILGDGSQIRHYTYGGDIARGLAEAMEQPTALNEDFNIASPVATSVRELAEKIIGRVAGPSAAVLLESDPAYANDVPYRAPDTSKARQLLGFEARTTLEEMLDEVIPWMAQALSDGLF